MKVLALVALSAIATGACAEVANTGSNQQAAKVEQYNYAMTLDVAQVVYRTPASDACGVQPARLVYDDHQGQRHILQYSMLGDGCSGG